jgi:hypothetical protein
LPKLTLTKRMYGVKLPSRVLQKALTADMMLSGKLPSMKECEVMMSGSDDDENVTMTYFEKVFPNTLEELESVWQLTDR